GHAAPPPRRTGAHPRPAHAGRGRARRSRARRAAGGADRWDSRGDGRARRRRRAPAVRVAELRVRARSVARGSAARGRAAGDRNRPRREAPPRLPHARRRSARRGRGRSSRMPRTVATAGHIDHGKTTLVEALTGKNTDRLPEEQARGISIDLGYAPLALADGTQLSIVDVPGHERFVRTMVAGATGVDLFLLVIDANEGARPQTLEHPAVLRLLGIERGVVALTKLDLVDDETLELARAEAEELVPGAPVVAVSARSGAGLDELRAAIAAVAKERSRVEAPTRLYVDRVFTLRGIGTVATGTLWSGSLGEGDELRAEPRGRTVRVRSVQVHDRPAERAEAGQRVAVALPGIERSELRRGDALVAPAAYPLSYRLDVQP